MDEQRRADLVEVARALHYCGLAIFLLFTLRLLVLNATRIRVVREPELRLLPSALAAPKFANFASGVVGISSATTPLRGRRRRH